MDVKFEAVDSCIACRWFLDKPVDPDIIRDLIDRAARAASGGNLQSWQLYTAGALAALKRTVAAHIDGRDPRHDDAEYPIYPKTMWEPYKGCREEHGVQPAAHRAAPPATTPIAALSVRCWCNSSSQRAGARSRWSPRCWPSHGPERLRRLNRTLFI